MNTNQPNEVATLGGGCFWCLEPIFQDLRGVDDAVAGYAGGQTPSPSYQQVCTGGTGHAEVVQVTFNPQIISFREILEVFFSVHNPTTPNRQGADIGPQYRSIILYHTPQQKEIAEAVIAEIDQQSLWEQPIVTEVAPLEVFYEAEDYHQKYYQKNPWAGYCQVVIRPKVKKFQKNYKERLKTNS